MEDTEPRLSKWLRTHQHVATWTTLCGVLLILYYLATGGG
jgi:hypothetical protein